MPEAYLVTTWLILQRDLECVCIHMSSISYFSILMQLLHSLDVMECDDHDPLACQARSKMISVLARQLERLRARGQVT